MAQLGQSEYPKSLATVLVQKRAYVPSRTLLMELLDEIAFLLGC